MQRRLCGGAIRGGGLPVCGGLHAAGEPVSHLLPHLTASVTVRLRNSAMPRPCMREARRRCYDRDLSHIYDGSSSCLPAGGAVRPGAAILVHGGGAAVLGTNLDTRVRGCTTSVLRESRNRRMNVHTRLAPCMASELVSCTCHGCTHRVAAVLMAANRRVFIIRVFIRFRDPNSLP